MQGGIDEILNDYVPLPEAARQLTQAFGPFRNGSKKVEPRPMRKLAGAYSFS
jgi:hypothetical protein